MQIWIFIEHRTESRIIRGGSISRVLIGRRLIGHASHQRIFNAVQIRGEGARLVADTTIFDIATPCFKMAATCITVGQ